LDGPKPPDKSAGRILPAAIAKEIQSYGDI